MDIYIHMWQLKFYKTVKEGDHACSFISCFGVGLRYFIGIDSYYMLLTRKTTRL